MSDAPATYLRAEQAQLQAVRAHPGDPDAALRLALLYHDHGRPAAAVPHYQAALRLRPRTPTHSASWATPWPNSAGPTTPWTATAAPPRPGPATPRR